MIQSAASGFSSIWSVTGVKFWMLPVMVRAAGMRAGRAAAAGVAAAACTGGAAPVATWPIGTAVATVKGCAPAGAPFERRMNATMLVTASSGKDPGLSAGIEVAILLKRSL